MDNIYLTDEQMAGLAQYEGTLRTAHESNYGRSIGTQGRQYLVTIVHDVTGKEPHINRWCQSCELDLYKQVARWYFDTKAKKEAELEAQRAAAAQVTEETNKAAKTAAKRRKK